MLLGAVAVQLGILVALLKSGVWSDVANLRLVVVTMGLVATTIMVVIGGGGAFVIAEGQWVALPSISFSNGCG